MEMVIIDYVFYRTYMAYKKGKTDPPRFSSICYIIACLIGLTFPIYGFVCDLFKYESSKVDEWIYWLGIIGIVVWTFRTFNRNHISTILYRYKNNRFNKKIPTWLFFLIFPICAVIGVALYINICIHIINPLNLEGCLYRLIFL